MKPHVLMHRLPYRAAIDDGFATKFVYTPPDQLGMEPEREALKKFLTEAGMEVAVLTECTDSLAAICIQDVGLPLVRSNGSGKVLMARMKCKSRQNEPYYLRPVLVGLDLEPIQAPNGVKFEAGDVVSIARTLVVGIGKRTNKDGFDWISREARHFGWNTVALKLGDGDFPHLTTGMTSAGTDLSGDTILVRNAKMVPDLGPLNNLRIKIVEVDLNDPPEADAANVLPVRDSVVIRAGAPKLRAALENARPEAKIVELPWDTMDTGQVGMTCTCMILTKTLRLGV